MTLVVATATGASAHANVVSTTPAQSQQYPSDAPPPRVIIVFDDGVSTTATSVGVYDGKGRGVTVVPTPSPNTAQVQVGLPRLVDGTYVVVWHVVSDDGHPEQGAFTFSVGSGGASMADIGSLLARASSGTGIGVAFDLDRALAFLTSLVLVGGLVFVRWRWPAALERRDVRGLLLGAAASAFVATIASIPLQAAYALGSGTSTLFDRDALSDVLHGRFGQAAIVRLVLVAVAAGMVVVPRRSTADSSRGMPVLTALLAVGVLETFAYAGHGYTGRLPQLGLVTDIAHLGGAALWLGGIAVLGLVLSHRSVSPAEANATAHATDRFSRLALPAVGVIVVSGAVQGWRQVGNWDALRHTTYGHLLAVKVLVVVAILIIASAAREVARERAAPAVRAAIGGWSATPRTPTESTLVELRNSVWVEGVLAIAVLLVTATLVVTPPGREAEAAASRPTARTLQVDAAGLRVAYTIAVQPALPGENTILVTPRVTSGSSFLPASLGAALHLRDGSSSTPLTFTPLSDGRFVTTAQLDARGDWNLDIADTTPSASRGGSATAQFVIP